jgi:epoxyqueuosine reductase QueG
LPEEVREGLPSGVSFAVALNPRIVAGIERGPSVEYYREYQRVNALLDRLGEAAAALLRERGHRAVALAATNVGVDAPTLSTRLPHKTVATRAGLGWIGKCALLVTEALGSAIRIASVLTDAELPVGTPVDTSSCGDCTVCVDLCPGNAASGTNWSAGMARESFLDAHACRRVARELAARTGIDETLCGLCIAVCPWTKGHLERALKG